MKISIYLTCKLALLLMLIVSCNPDSIDEPSDEQINIVADTGSCSGLTNLLDTRDGQNYRIVQIGDQWWFAENLRYSSNMNQVNGQLEWAAIYNNGNPTNQSAWCYREDDISNDSLYGKLYNWYAVTSLVLCPSGWHVPTDSDWTILSNYLGGEFIAGGKMKSTTGWIQPNTGATNESCFSALPGEFRNWSGSFDGTHDGFWWSSTENDSSGAMGFYMYYTTGNLYKSNYHKSSGLSCRCIMD